MVSAQPVSGRASRWLLPPRRFFLADPPSSRPPAAKAPVCENHIRWHSLRRKFATDMRTELPLRDLCHAGGWQDAQTILKHYQQPDEDLIRGALDDREDSGVGSNRQENRQEAQS